MNDPLEYREKKQAEFAKSHNREALDAHWDRVRNHEKTIEEVLFAQSHRPKERKQVMEYERARHLVIEIIRERVTKFKTSDTTKLLLTNMTKYFINDPSGQFDINKGILLFGKVGTGKTTTFRIFERLAGALDILDGYDKKFKIIKTSDIVLDIRAKENEGFIRPYFSNSFCFDDLGKEPKEVKIYGNSSTVMGDILFNRYDRSAITHATTNLNEQELMEHYGERIHSRMMEMFNWVHVTGEDHRKQ